VSCSLNPLALWYVSCSALCVLHVWCFVFESLEASAVQKIKLLLADDSTIVRRGICQLLACHRCIQVVGEAASFAQTIELANGLDPQVVLMDLHMPDEAEFTPQRVRADLNKGSSLLAMSLRNDEEATALAHSFGAAMLLDKAQLARVLIPSIVQCGGL
jgi:DNA-binding NarL/FixJ family response regulator